MYSKKFITGVFILISTCSFATAALDTQKPISLLTLYHRIDVFQGRDYAKSLDIDNGSLAAALESAIKGKIPALLMNGSIAFPLVFATAWAYSEDHDIPLPSEMVELVDKFYLSTNITASNFGTWDNVYESKACSNFLIDYIPYFVKKIGLHELTDERFVLFIRRDISFDKEKAFNFNLLKEVKISSSDDVVSFLQELKKRRLTLSTIADSIKSIFNPTQSEYRWNIAIVGHGAQAEEEDVLMLAKKEPMPETPYSEGLIANIPPRQFAKLLDFFYTMPINIVFISTCFSGGYMAFLMQQELLLLRSLMYKKLMSLGQQEVFTHLVEQALKRDVTTEAPEKFLKRVFMSKREHPDIKSKLILATSATFDLPSFDEDIGMLMQKLEYLFAHDLTQDNERLAKTLEAILNESGAETAMFLMPDEDSFRMSHYLMAKISNAPITGMISRKKAGILSHHAIQMILKSENMQSQEKKETFLQKLLNEALVFPEAQTMINILETCVTEKVACAANPDFVPLLLAALKHERDEVAQLVNQGVNIDAADIRGNTSLAYAVRANNLEAIKILLDNGASPNICSSHTPPLIEAINSYAFRLKQQDAANPFIPFTLLKDKRIDLNIQNGLGETALMRLFQSLSAYDALQTAFLETGGARIVENVDVDIALVQYLIQRKARIDLKNIAGQTAFDYAREAGAPQKVLDVLRV